MAVYSQTINTFRRFHLLKGLFITHPCLWKCLQTFLAIKFHFELLIFFIVFFLNSEQYYIDPEKKSSSKRLPSSFNGVFTFKKWNFTFSFIISFLCLKCPIISKQCSNISAHCKQKKTTKTSVYPPFSLMNLIAIISLWIVRIPILR